MAKSKAQKADLVAKLTDRLQRMKGAAFSSAMHFTMEDADALRKKARGMGVDVFVAKKTFLEIAAKNAGIEGVARNAFDGSVLAAVSFNDEVSAAKLLKELAKQKESVALMGGILEGKMVNKAEVTRLADLPSKEQLLGQLVGTLQAPVSGFVRVLGGNLSGLVTVVKAISEKKSA
jgi:large subunit ribosomal protein L10